MDSNKGRTFRGVWMVCPIPGDGTGEWWHLLYTAMAMCIILWWACQRPPSPLISTACQLSDFSLRSVTVAAVVLLET